MIIDLALITFNRELERTTQEIADRHGFAMATFESVMDFYNASPQASCIKVVFIDLVSLCEKDYDLRASGIAAMVQSAGLVAPQSYIGLIISNKVEFGDLAFLKKSGAKFCIYDDQLKRNCKYEFVLSQRIDAAYFEVKKEELAFASKVPFDIFFLLPKNGRYIPVHRANQNIDAHKVKTFKKVGPLYVRRDEVGAYRDYLANNSHRIKESHIYSCRAQFLSLSFRYFDLLLDLIDDSETATFEEGRGTFAKCYQLANEILLPLSKLEEAFEVVNNSIVGSFGVFERAPARAVYAGLVGMLSNLCDPKDLVFVALLSDIGMLELPRTLITKLRNGLVNEFTSEERALYETHPTTSLNMLLNARLPVADELKKMILCTHESYDGKGFPSRIARSNVPIESQIVRFCEMIDERSTVNVGDTRPDLNHVRLTLLEEEFAGTRFSPEVLATIRIKTRAA